MHTRNGFSLSSTIMSLFVGFLSLAVEAAPGDLDTSFGGGQGYVKDFFLFDKDNQGRVVAQQSSGKLLMAGKGYFGEGYNFAVSRYNTDGSLDKSFGVDGYAHYDLGSPDWPDEPVRDMLVMPDDSFILLGYTWSGSLSAYVIGLVGFTADGALDYNFDAGNPHYRLSTPGGDTYGNSLIRQSDGKLVIAGTSGGGTAKVLVWRLNSDLSLDTTFGPAGYRELSFGSSTWGESMIQQADGKLLVSGRSNNDVLLVRYNSDGSLDSGFDGDGILTRSASSGKDYGRDVLQQSDGKLVVVGYDTSDSFMMRFNLDGTRDNSFGDLGLQKFDGGPGSEKLFSVVQLADGKLLGSGYTEGADGDVLAIKVDTDGSLDTSFDSDGRVTLDGGTNVDDLVFSVM